MGNQQELWTTHSVILRKSIEQSRKLEYITAVSQYWMLILGQVEATMDNVSLYDWFILCQFSISFPKWNDHPLEIIHSFEFMWGGYVCPVVKQCIHAVHVSLYILDTNNLGVIWCGMKKSCYQYLFLLPFSIAKCPWATHLSLLASLCPRV
jgi:hypothetical protein